MATGIFGYFTLNINEKNLAGSYMNWSTPGSENEIGSKTAGLPDEFVGNYDTNWTDTAYREARLEITLFRDDTLELNWIITSNDDQGTRFRGRGIVEGRRLVGFYEML